MALAHVSLFQRSKINGMGPDVVEGAIAHIRTYIKVRIE